MNSSKDVNQAIERILDKIEWVVRSKTAAVTGLYFLALIILGADAYKALVIALVAGVLLSKAIAPQIILRSGLVLFVLAALSWTGVAPIAKWTGTLVAIVDHALT
ncbi:MULTISPECIES: hypothetical protein [Bradyrhizobium]|uniref:AI-2E family transporter n=1 Tax=Bradyrhizobium brasilense TaxID=1419277 RepID=A0ABY8JMV9_9BRAD|nr:MULTISPECIES: hypothetical protein [Bradyrhizobium]WFU66722.1 hypothetical protein QA636_14935 [Bradyrhizobium brasilense]